MNPITRTGVVTSPRNRAMSPDASMDAVARQLREMGARVTCGERSVSFVGSSINPLRGQVLAGITGGEVRWEGVGAEMTVHYSIDLGPMAAGAMFIGTMFLVSFFFSLVFGEPSLLLVALGAATVLIGLLKGAVSTSTFEAWLERSSCGMRASPWLLG